MRTRTDYVRFFNHAFEMYSRVCWWIYIMNNDNNNNGNNNIAKISGSIYKWNKKKKRGARSTKYIQQSMRMKNENKKKI